MVNRSGVGYADFSGGDANHTIGCTPISAGCANCYARALIQDRGGRDFSKITLYPDKLRRLAAARFEANGTPFRRGPGSRPLIFPVDLGDHFHNDVPADYLFQALDTYTARDDADWLVLTKRVHRMVDVISRWLNMRGLDELPGHIWPGVTVENNAALWRVDHLMDVPSQSRWLSIEPILEEIDTRVLLDQMFQYYSNVPGTLGVCWIIAGAESGPHRRNFDVQWIRELRELRRRVGPALAFYYKQGSHQFPGRDDELDGRKWKEIPDRSIPRMRIR